jgi:hypothetical protein
MPVGHPTKFNSGTAPAAPSDKALRPEHHRSTRTAPGEEHEHQVHGSEAISSGRTRRKPVQRPGRRPARYGLGPAQASEEAARGPKNRVLLGQHGPDLKTRAELSPATVASLMGVPQGSHGLHRSPWLRHRSYVTVFMPAHPLSAPRRDATHAASASRASEAASARGPPCPQGIGRASRGTPGKASRRAKIPRSQDPTPFTLVEISLGSWDLGILMPARALGTSKARGPNGPSRPSTHSGGPRPDRRWTRPPRVHRPRMPAWIGHGDGLDLRRARARLDQVLDR